MRLGRSGVRQACDFCSRVMRGGSTVFIFRLDDEFAVCSVECVRSLVLKRIEFHQCTLLDEGHYAFVERGLHFPDEVAR